MSALSEESELRELLAKTNRIDRGSYEYYEAHFENLQETHGGEIVAIVDNGVVESVDQSAGADELHQFIQKVRKEHGKEAFITHITRPDQSLIL